MAIDATVTDIVQEINDARVDMQSFASFMFEPADVMITRRLAPDTHSLQHYLDYLDAIKLVFTQESGDVTVGDRTIKTVSQLIADGEQQTSDAVVDIGTRADTAIGNANTSLNNAIDAILRAGGHVGYPTLAAATADKANIAAKTIVEITNDTTANNGVYLYDGTNFTKSSYDVVAIAKAYTDSKITELKEKSSGTFGTLAELNLTELADGSYALVANDTYANNGYYQKQAGIWTRTAFDVQKIVDDATSVVAYPLPISVNSNWKPIRSTVNLVDGNLEVTCTIAELDEGVYSGVAQLSGVDFTAGNKYFLRARVKVDTENCSLLQFGSALSFVGGRVIFENPNKDVWYEISAVVEAAATNSNYMLLVHSYPTANDALNSKMTVDYISMVNLTELFPATLPSKNVLDKLFIGEGDIYHLKLTDLLKYGAYTVTGSTEPTAPAPTINYDKVIELTDSDKQQAGEVELYKGQFIQGFIDVDGVVQVGGSYSRWTGYIDVSNYTSIKLAGFNRTDCNYAFYDASHGLVSLGKRGTYDINSTLVVPDGAKYFGRTLSPNAVSEPTNLISIKGIYARDRFSNFATKYDVLPYSVSDKNLEVKEELWNAGTKIEGNFTATGVDTSIAGFKHFMIDVTDYNALELTRFNSEALKRYWLDRDKQVIKTMDAQADPTSWVLNGNIEKPINARYFAGNVVTPTVTDDQGLIYGKRGVNSSDFQRKGVTGDAAAGWETAPDLLSTSNVIEIFNPHYPEIMPLKIMNNGIMDNYNYGNRLGMETAITREAWGMQMWMNWTKDRHPLVQRGTKNIMSENALIQEWGIEGLQWHVVPPSVDVGSMRTTQAIKFGGHSPRTNTNYSFAKASIGQILTPVWSERSDGQSFGWIKNSTNSDNDDAIPTRVMLRESVHFKSPEYYRMGYGNTQNATWDRHVRSRGTFKEPTATADGDSIHKQLYSVVTGKDAQNNPILKDVAQIEIVYDETAGADGDNAASIIFRTWNNATESWDEKLKL